MPSVKAEVIDYSVEHENRDDQKDCPNSSSVIAGEFVNPIENAPHGEKV